LKYYFIGREQMATLSEVTIRNYTASIKKMEREGLTLSDYDAVCEWIESRECKIGTKKAYLNALANHFRISDPVLAERYRERMRPMARTLAHDSRGQKLTDAEREKYLPYDDICAVYEKAEDCPFTPLEDKMLIGFYTQMPPVRSDYCRLRIYLDTDPDMTVNHIEIRGGLFNYRMAVITVRIVEHKTASSSGTLERVLPEFLRRDVVGFICDYKHSFKQEPEYLFDFSPAEITTRLQRVFKRYTGKEISVNIIRHAYITKQTEGRPPLAQLEAEAAEMGHSVLTHETYRRLDAEYRQNKVVLLVPLDPIRESKRIVLPPLDND
jgi:hypothetical protein